MSNLAVSFIQTSLHWHEPEANRQHLERQASTISVPTDLLVLPEMFTTGFSMTPQGLAEPTNGPTLAWMQQLASTHDAVVTGSLMVEEAGQYFNRLLWVRPDGSWSHYDKRHRFTMAGEHTVYEAGTARLIEEWRGWRICPLVCYDLRFPVWSRNNPAALYDLLLYTANWPAARRTAWIALLRARAIENVAYTMGVNRIGRDGNGADYAGDSALIDMRGEYMVEVGNQATTITRTLRRDELLEFRQRFPALQDADAFELSI
ncbi:amidohydrolase [Hymenobacter lapidiphilus]|uniref:Omega-amidase YafV n=1 Tax=Hymenobacter lapidiphilus TaxID=2608003 RepID=A0A7Y7PQW3_9BACT|nr:amidohydrolase [Hymenobacter lapidiphilus]NVO32393.1 amidohydrolase [Hymenobacter lapidiphilus]